MKNKLMIITLILIVCLLITRVVGQFILSNQFKKEVAQLFSLSKPGTRKIYNKEQIVGLPEPVQRYFAHVLTEGDAYANYTRFKHDGQFKTGLDKPWVNIKGEQYVTTATPGFIWKGSTSLFTARDMYIGDKGRLTVALFSVAKIVDAKGASYNQGELLRWLGESVLYPTNLLPSERLQWSAVDANSASFKFNYNGMSLVYLVTFNDLGEIIQLETKRFMDADKLETWIIKLADYKNLDGMLVPTTTEVLWRLEKGDFSYARFLIKELEYDKAEKY